MNRFLLHQCAKTIQEHLQRIFILPGKIQYKWKLEALSKNQTNRQTKKKYIIPFCQYFLYEVKKNLFLLA